MLMMAVRMRTNHLRRAPLVCLRIHFHRPYLHRIAPYPGSTLRIKPAQSGAVAFGCRYQRMEQNVFFLLLAGLPPLVVSPRCSLICLTTV